MTPKWIAWAVVLGAAGLTAQVRDDGNRTLPYYRHLVGAGPSDLAATPAGRVYVVGTTSSPDYPVTPDALDRSCGSDGLCNRSMPLPAGYSSQTDAFLSVLDPDGSLRYSTFLGGAGSEGSIHRTERSVRVALTADAQIWIAGMTTSAGGFDNLPPSSRCDGDAIWVLRVDAALSRARDFQCLPGSGSDQLGDIAADRDGNLWLTGSARSEARGFSDAFVLKLEPGRATPTYSTRIAGSGSDSGISLAIAPDGDVVIAGMTDSSDLPLVRPFGGRAQNFDGFVVRLDPSRDLVEYATYVGGSGYDEPAAVAVHPDGDVYVAGDTTSPDFPGAAGVPRGTDVFALAIALDGALRAAARLGGSSVDAAVHVSLLIDGHVLVAGRTYSADFPLVAALPSRFTPSIQGDVPFFAVLDPGLAALERSTFASAEEHRGFLSAVGADARHVYLAAGVGPLAVGEMFIRRVRVSPDWHQ